jgi:hypothetical protein
VIPDGWETADFGYVCCFFESDSIIECTPDGSNTTFVPSQRALAVNSEHSSEMSVS